LATGFLTVVTGLALVAVVDSDGLAAVVAFAVPEAGEAGFSATGVGVVVVLAETGVASASATGVTAVAGSVIGFATNEAI
jgi:hypothetical protein